MYFSAHSANVAIVASAAFGGSLCVPLSNRINSLQAKLALLCGQLSRFCERDGVDWSKSHVAQLAAVAEAEYPRFGTGLADAQIQTTAVRNESPVLGA